MRRLLPWVLLGMPMLGAAWGVALILATRGPATGMGWAVFLSPLALVGLGWVGLMVEVAKGEG